MKKIIAVLISILMCPIIIFSTANPYENIALLEKGATATTDNYFTGGGENYGIANNSIDGNDSTIWHIDPARPLPANPVTIIIAFDKIYEISEMGYLSRQDAYDGAITSAVISSSLDGVNFTDIKNITWAGSKAKKTESFTPHSAKYFKLYITDNSGYATAATIEVLGRENYIESLEATNILLSGGVVDHEMNVTFDVSADAIKEKSLIEWVVAESEQGSYIHLANGATYTPDATSIGKYIKAKITPVNVEGMVGQSFLSNAVKITGDPTIPYNVALSANGGMATASTDFFSSVSKVIDGKTKGEDWISGNGGWNSAGTGYPHWVEISFSSEKEITSVDVFSGQDDYANPVEPTDGLTFATSGLVDFKVQFLNSETQWQDVKEASGNNLVWWKSGDFAKVKTEKVRIFITKTGDNWGRITEVKVMGTDVINIVDDKINATDVSIGGQGIGTDLTINYDYLHEDGIAEGNSGYQWFVCNTIDGEYIAIKNEKSKTFRPSPIMVDAFLKAAVTPVDKNGSTGKQEFSAPFKITAEKNNLFFEDFLSPDVLDTTGYDTKKWVLNIRNLGFTEIVSGNNVNVASGEIVLERGNKDGYVRIDKRDINNYSGNIILEAKLQNLDGRALFDLGHSNGLLAYAEFSDNIAINGKTVATGNLEWNVYRFYIRQTDKKIDISINGMVVAKDISYFQDGAVFSSLGIYLASEKAPSKINLDYVKIFNFNQDTSKSKYKVSEIKNYIDGNLTTETSGFAGKSLHTEVKLDNFSGENKNVFVLLRTVDENKFKQYQTTKKIVPNGSENFLVKTLPINVLTNEETIKTYVWHNEEMKPIAVSQTSPSDTETTSMISDISYNYSQRIIKVNSKLSHWQNRVVTALVLKDGDIYGVFEGNVSETNDVDFQLSLPENVLSGVYTVKLAVSNLGNSSTMPDDAKIGEINILDNTEEADILGKLKNSATMEIEIQNCIDSKIFLNDVDMQTDYQADKLQIVNEMKNHLSGIESIDDFAKKLYETIGICTLNKSAESEVLIKLKRYEHALDLTLTNDFEDVKIDFGKTFIDVKNNEFAGKITAGNVSKAVRTTTAIAKINIASALGVEKILNDYNDIFKLDLTGDYKNADKLAVGKALIRKDYKKLSDIKNDFEKAVKAPAPKPQEKPGGGTTPSKPVGNINQNSNIDLFDDEKIDIAEQDFPDVPKEFWGYTAINALRNKKIVSGNENGMFLPNEHITREQFVKMVVIALNAVDKTANVDFEDVNKNAWYYLYISSAYKVGIINGISKEKFGIGENITRQDMAVILYRAAEIKGISITEIEEIIFKDQNEIADYAKEAIRKLGNAKIINGFENNIFSPKSFATKAQAAKMIYEFMVCGGII